MDTMFAQCSQRNFSLCSLCNSSCHCGYFFYNLYSGYFIIEQNPKGNTFSKKNLFKNP